MFRHVVMLIAFYEVPYEISLCADISRCKIHCKERNSQRKRKLCNFKLDIRRLSLIVRNHDLLLVVIGDNNMMGRRFKTITNVYGIILRIFF